MIKRFDVVWVNLDPTIGKEIKKKRPCVVVSPDELNHHLGTVIVVPVTSTIKNWPFRLNSKVGNKQSSMACDQLRTVSKERLGAKITILKKPEQTATLDILQKMFSA